MSNLTATFVYRDLFCKMFSCTWSRTTSTTEPMVSTWTRRLFTSYQKMETWQMLEPWTYQLVRCLQTRLNHLKISTKPIFPHHLFLMQRSNVEQETVQQSLQELQSGSSHTIFYNSCTAQASYTGMHATTSSSSLRLTHNVLHSPS